VNFVDPTGLDEAITCLVDGMETSCSTAFGLVGGGAATVSNGPGFYGDYRVINHVPTRDGGFYQTVFYLGPPQRPAQNPGGEVGPQDLRLIKEVTDCDLFAAEVDRIALQDPNNTVVFMRGLTDRFNAEGYDTANTEFASTGFKGEFRDDVGPSNSANQVRHYVGGLRAVFTFGEAGSAIMTARENHGTPSNRADLRLNAVSKQHALALSNMTARPTDLANMIRRDVCAPKP
jgi:hypothetical protein